MLFWELCLEQNIVKYFSDGSDSAEGRFQKLRNFKSQAITWIHASKKSSIEALNAILAVITSWLALFLQFLCLQSDHSQYDDLLISWKFNVIEIRCAGKSRPDKLKLIGKLGICMLLLIRSLCWDMLIGMIDGVKNIVHSNRITAEAPEKFPFCHPDIDAGLVGFEFEIDSGSVSDSEITTFYDIFFKDVNDNDQDDEELDDDDDGFPHTYPIVENTEITVG